jgi:hypothetical protein
MLFLVLEMLLTSTALIIAWFPQSIIEKQSSGMWHHVDVVLTDVSEEHIASTFRVKEKNKKICW